MGLGIQGIEVVVLGGAHIVDHTVLGAGQQEEIIVHKLSRHHHILGQGGGTCAILLAASEGLGAGNLAEACAVFHSAGLEIVQVVAASQDIAYLQVI